MLHPSLEKKLIKKIKKYQEQGFNNYQIKLALIRQHYPSHIIESLITLASTESKHHQLNKDLILAVIGIVVLIPLMVFTTYNVFKTEYLLCDSEECFIEAANACEAAVYRQESALSTFLIKTKGCKLIKEAEVIGDELLYGAQGTVMICRYEETAFNPELITTMTRGIDDCMGDLKEFLAVYKEKNFNEGF